MKSLHIISFALIVVALLSFVNAASSFSSVASYVNNPSYSSSYSTYYGGSAGSGLSSRYGTYWPILNDPSSCQAQQDLLLHVPPGGCQPSVVRSDLLAEQDVPVFCQIDAFKLNPLVDIKSIENIVFTGSKYPENVRGAGFHPAQAALRTHDILLGEPLINNIGYVVVVLKKQEVESKLPSFVNVTLTGHLQYEAGNSLGIGRTDFYLTEQSDTEWAAEKNRQSFWNGKYAIRAESIETDHAVLSIYAGDAKVSTVRVERGKLSQPIYVPGSYCRVGLQASFDGVDVAQAKARIEIGDERGYDVLDVYEGSKISNGRCSVERIVPDTLLEDGGYVNLRCGSQRVRLALQSTFMPTGKEIIPFTKKVSVGKLSLEGVQANAQQLVKSAEQTARDIVSGKISDIRSVQVCEVSLTAQDIKIPGLLPGFYSVRKDSRTGQDWTLFYRSVKTEVGESYENRLTDPSVSWAPTLKNELVARCENRKLPEQRYDLATEQYFNESIAAYEKVSDDYTLERESTAATETYGEQALQKAIALAKQFNKDETRVGLMTKYVELYPTSSIGEEYRLELEKIYSIDLTKAGTSIYLDNRYRTVRLVSVSKPSYEDSYASFVFDGRRIKLGVGQDETFENQYGLGGFRITNIRNAEQVQINIKCPNEGTVAKSVLDDKNVPSDVLRDARRKVMWSTFNQFSSYLSPDTTIRVGESSVNVCGKSLVLEDVHVSTSARITLVPEVRSETDTNLTVNIGIEKRAIQLSPNKTVEKIAQLNQSIQKWESISKNLGNVVSGLKGACFATAGVLTVKNFLDGVDGTALARQHAMEGQFGWTQRCKDAIATGKINRGTGDLTTVSYKTMTECFNGEQGGINKDIASREAALQQVNQQLKSIEGQPGVTTGTFANGKSVDTQKAMKDYVASLKQKYPDNPTVQKLESVADGQGFTPYRYSDLRDLDYALELKQKGGSVSQSAEAMYKDTMKRIDVNRESYETYKRSQNVAGSAFGSNVALVGNTARGVPARASVMELTGSKGAYKLNGKPLTTGDINLGDSTAGMFVAGSELTRENQPGTFKQYLVVGKRTGDLLEPISVYEYTETTGTEGTITLKNSPYTEQNIGQFKSTYGVTSFENVGDGTFHTAIRQSDLKIRYFETGPDKGMAYLVPFDVANGWYVRVQSTLGIGNQQQAYDASGVPKAWYICNVGADGIVNEHGDDCQLVNDGYSSDARILGQSTDLSKLLVKDSRAALMEANRKKGQQFIVINGNKLQQGAPVTPYDGVQCQDFMSPSDCKLLFNVCDPVICPATRCDFGGQYPVADVVQTGIVGSTLLCLPNIREGVYVPVCLTGIHAGIDSFVSILKSYRDCLQENVDSGKTIGICDQITSVYMCEFFWRQLAPLANILLPKLVESAYGQGARGGGEYLTVMGAWQNMEKSVGYFKNTYAVNSFNAFKVRSLEEAGTPVCKAFVSAKIPAKLDSLLEPESPPQFHAWFSTTPFSDVTVPATSQYKVFYHIFAGKDTGVYYKVYLKNPPNSAYYTASPTLLIRAGFAARGEYATETRDFTAPEGYRELCIEVNGKEECGFGQVSTSFAVNQLRDAYVSDALKENDITTEKGCISGSPSLLPVIANTNPQAAFEESVAPQLYQRGIVRICSSQNPAGNNDPRYVEVGYCGDKNLRCWLDKKSVDNAITDNNLGVKNATLQQLEQYQRATLESSGSLLTDSVSVEQIKKNAAAAAELVSRFRESQELSRVRDAVAVQLKQIDSDFGVRLEKLFYNHHKAQVLLIRASLKALVAQVSYNNVNHQAFILQAEGGDFGSTPAQTGVTQTPSNIIVIDHDNIEASKIYLTYNEAAKQWQWSFYQSGWLPLSQTFFVDRAADDGLGFTGVPLTFEAQQIFKQLAIIGDLYKANDFLGKISKSSLTSPSLTLKPVDEKRKSYQVMRNGIFTGVIFIPSSNVASQKGVLTFQQDASFRALSDTSKGYAEALKRAVGTDIEIGLVTAGSNMLLHVDKAKSLLPPILYSQLYGANIVGLDKTLNEYTITPSSNSIGVSGGISMGEPQENIITLPSRPGVASSNTPQGFIPGKSFSESAAKIPEILGKEVDQVSVIGIEYSEDCNDVIAFRWNEANSKAEALFNVNFAQFCPRGWARPEWLDLEEAEARQEFSSKRGMNEYQYDEIRTILGAGTKLEMVNSILVAHYSHYEDSEVYLTDSQEVYKAAQTSDSKRKLTPLTSLIDASDERKYLRIGEYETDFFVQKDVVYFDYRNIYSYVHLSRIGKLEGDLTISLSAPYSSLVPSSAQQVSPSLSLDMLDLLYNKLQRARIDANGNLLLDEITIEQVEELRSKWQTKTTAQTSFLEKIMASYMQERSLYYTFVPEGENYYVHVGNVRTSMYISGNTGSDLYYLYTTGRNQYIGQIEEGAVVLTFAFYSNNYGSFIEEDSPGMLPLIEGLVGKRIVDLSTTKIRLDAETVTKLQETLKTLNPAQPSPSISTPSSPQLVFATDLPYTLGDSHTYTLDNGLDVKVRTILAKGVETRFVVWDSSVDKAISYSGSDGVYHPASILKDNTVLVHYSYPEDNSFGTYKARAPAAERVAIEVILENLRKSIFKGDSFEVQILAA